MEWVPIVFITFKVLALSTGMFFAIKWHRDQETSSDRTDMTKVIWQVAGFTLMAVIVFALIYVILDYLDLLPAGI
jgi:hypothetical protein